MKFSIEHTFIPDVKIVVPKVNEDDRGFFMEVFNVPDFDSLGIPPHFVQMNHSRSVKGVVRGLHFQWDPPQAKLMRVTVGTAFLVAVDIRKNSPTLGRWYGNIFSADNKKQLWAPAGFARGICALETYTEVQYLVTELYNPKNESQILWDDPVIGIGWPLNEVLISEKDKKAMTLDEWLSTPQSNNFLL